jgi:hypothetical protein
MEISTNTTVTFDIPGTLDNQKVCVACIVDPAANYAAVYTNGVLEQSFAASWPALGSVSTAWSFIGRSLWSADAWLNASIDEFRVYDGRLTPDEIATDFKFGPDALALPITLAQSGTAPDLNFSWPSYALGFTLEANSDLTGNWSVTGAPILSNDLWPLTLPATNDVQFFRLRR